MHGPRSTLFILLCLLLLRGCSCYPRHNRWAIANESNEALEVVTPLSGVMISDLANGPVPPAMMRVEDVVGYPNYENTDRGWSAMPPDRWKWDSVTRIAIIRVEPGEAVRVWAIRGCEPPEDCMPFFHSYLELRGATGNNRLEGVALVKAFEPHYRGLFVLHYH